MREPSPNATAPPWRAARYWLVPGALTVLMMALVWMLMRRSDQADALLRSAEARLQTNAALLAYASQRARPLYQTHCAGCHGADLTGDHSKGAANLGDGIWLHGTGQINDIEQTILYGIRSGHPKARNLDDMPGFGRIGQLTRNEIGDVVEYVLQISHQPHNAAAAERGRLIYQDRGACYDCHAIDGHGISDYGTPGLTGRGGAWLYGGARAALYKSIFDGRHGLCPAWIGKLSFVEIRALAAFLYSRSHGSNDPQAAQSSNPAGT